MKLLEPAGIVPTCTYRYKYRYADIQAGPVQQRHSCPDHALLFELLHSTPARRGAQPHTFCQFIDG